MCQFYCWQFSFDFRAVFFPAVSLSFYPYHPTLSLTFRFCTHCPFATSHWLLSFKIVHFSAYEKQCCTIKYSNVEKWSFNGPSQMKVMSHNSYILCNTIAFNTEIFHLICTNLKFYFPCECVSEFEDETMRST